MDEYEKDEIYLRVTPKKEIKCMLVSVEEYDKLKEENKQLREMLIECQPTRGAGENCVFCGKKIWRSGHADDCKYFNVIKESEDK